MEITVARHCVGQDPESGLSPLQKALIDRPEKVRIADAPTGAGKSYAFQQALANDCRVLFVVPTRRLAQNLIAGLSASLVRDHGWNGKAVSEKLALWNSDETKRLVEAGETGIGTRRIREIYGLNYAMEGGEMVIAVPEVVSGLLLRPIPEKGLADTGVFEILNNFEHIVFDEFHTISPRGFGLAGLFAKLAAEHTASRAKVSFLSATPLDIRQVLRRLSVPENEIIELREELVPSGRVVHGDVRLTLCEYGDMVQLVRDNMGAIMEQIRQGRQVVVIYDTLADLQRHLASFEKMFDKAGVKPGRTLVIDSIDDTRTNVSPGGFFAAGRSKDPEQYDILIATASVEMGVTFKTDLLLMEPGFEALNFLQRYGRAARGDRDGHVMVRFDDTTLKKNAWFRDLKRWIGGNKNRTVKIGDLTSALTKTVRKRFKDCPEDGQAHFGKMPNRAAYSAGLYWNVLMGHFSNKGHRWKHLKDHQPKAAKEIFRLLKEIRKMESDAMFGRYAKEWCDRFENEARTLRDIGKNLRVIENNGKGEIFHAGELWLRKNSKILDTCPLRLADDGVEELHIKGTLRDNLLEERRFVKAVKNSRFPHTGYMVPIVDDALLVVNWRREFENKNGPGFYAWDLYPESMAAASTLVGLTGLVVSDDLDVESVNCVL